MWNSVFLMILIYHLQSGGSCDGSSRASLTFHASSTFTVYISCSQTFAVSRFTALSSECCVSGNSSSHSLPIQPNTLLSEENRVVQFYSLILGKQLICKLPQFWFWHGNIRIKLNPPKVLANTTSIPTSLFGSLSEYAFLPKLGHRIDLPTS